MIRIFWALGAFGVLLLAVGMTRPEVDVASGAGRPSILDPAGLGPGLVGLGLAFLGASIFLALSILPVDARRKRLAAQNPDGPTFIARADARLAHALNRRSGTQPTRAADIPAFVLVTANPSGVFYWGRSESVPLAKFEWAEISRLSAEPIHMGRETVGITLSALVPDEAPLSVTVAPVNESYPLLSYAAADRTRLIVAQILAQNIA